MSLAVLRRLAADRRAKIGFLLCVGLAVFGEQVAFAVTGGGGSHNRPAAGVRALPHTLPGRIDLALTEALGASDRGVRRDRLMSIRHAAGNRDDIVTIRWAINNDLSAGTVGDGAQADAYLIFGHVFSLHAPIDRVKIIGTYPAGSPVRERVVMRLWMGRSTASLIGQGGWGSIDATALWPLVHRTYVDPEFEPVPLE